jgi:hypothetical protein
MKVKELIEILEEFDGEQEVLTIRNGIVGKANIDPDYEVGTKKQSYYDEIAKLRGEQFPKKADGIFIPVLTTTYEVGPNAGEYKTLAGEWNGGVKYTTEEFSKHHNTKICVLIH